MTNKEVRQVANLMTQSSATAERNYQHLMKDKRAVKIYRKLEQTARKSDDMMKMA